MDEQEFLEDMAVDDLIEDNLDDEDIILDEPTTKNQILSENDEEATEVLHKNNKQPVTKVQIRETGAPKK
jgi:hypothetical protein